MIEDARRKFDKVLTVKAAKMPAPPLALPVDALKARNTYFELTQVEGGFPDIISDESLAGDTKSLIGLGVWSGLAIRDHHEEVLDGMSDQIARRARAGWVQAMKELGIPEIYAHGTPLNGSALQGVVDHLYMADPRKVLGMLELLTPIADRLDPQIHGDEYVVEFSKGLLEALAHGVRPVHPLKAKYRGLDGFMAKRQDQTRGLAIIEPGSLGLSVLNYDKETVNEAVSNPVVKAALYKAIMFSAILRHHRETYGRLTASRDAKLNDYTATRARFGEYKILDRVPAGIVSLEALYAQDDQDDDVDGEPTGLTNEEAINMLTAETRKNTRALETMSTTINHARVSPDQADATSALLHLSDEDLGRLLDRRNQAVFGTQHTSKAVVRTHHGVTIIDALRHAVVVKLLEASHQMTDAVDLPAMVAGELCKIGASVEMQRLDLQRVQIQLALKDSYNLILAEIAKKEQEVDALRTALLSS